ncbi:unnamed protein product [Dibothriocephalus latus]|uniref:Purinergic receptor n=1 Tax=Dibothriocephalus latus TaxID=60516 RepID=A0A3P7MZK5_DIBLA|nr:unnamed protein product [Dibothriocephalus latus]
MQGAVKSLFIYETPKVVEIKNWKIGLTQCVLQAVIAIYVVWYVLLYEKGYQVNDTAVSSVTTKVKGNIISKCPSEDLVYPALEHNAFFIMTNYIKTKAQRSTSRHKSACNSDSDCANLTASAHEIGVHTGKCLKISSGSGVCEIYAWCPLENDTHVLKNGVQSLDFIRNYTVYIKNDIEFPKFNVKR